MSGFGRRKAASPIPGAGDAGRLRLVTPAAAPAMARGRAAQGISFDAAKRLVQPVIARSFDPAIDAARPRGELAAAIGAAITRALDAETVAVDPRVHRDLVSHFLTTLLGAGARSTAAPATDQDQRSAAQRAMDQVLPAILDRIDSGAAAAMNRGELARKLRDLLPEVLAHVSIILNAAEQRELVTLLIDDLRGLGPLEPLLADDSITDIMANGPGQIYVERQGRLELCPARFRDTLHMMGVIARIVTAVGRRIDEASPLVDARLADGSRVNIIIPPLSVDGPALSIRKFARRTFSLEQLIATGSMSPEMAAVLETAARARLNILVSGGTGSGKTTLLNALSRLISPSERIVTIEDAAELQLQQPHVVRLETRPPNLEGRGEVTQRDLVRNALRMRPDRIILGEIRGAEAIDMLQAMNTGHDGSLGTIHANRPREALTRLENMVAMAGFNLPVLAVRTQIAAAVELIVQVARMRDGRRRVTSITEVIGMEGDVITLQELFHFQQEPTASEAVVAGRFVSSGVRPHFAARAEQAGLGDLLTRASMA